MSYTDSKQAYRFLRTPRGMLGVCCGFCDIFVTIHFVGKAKDKPNTEKQIDVFTPGFKRAARCDSDRVGQPSCLHLVRAARLKGAACPTGKWNYGWTCITEEEKQNGKNGAARKGHIMDID